MKSPFYRIGLGILLISIIIFMLKQINFIFEPIIVLIKTLSMPFIVAGILYYLLLPFFNFLLKKGVNKALSIVTIFTGLALIISSFFVFISPMIIRQLKRFTDKIPEIAISTEQYIKDIASHEMIKKLHLESQLEIGKLSDWILSKTDTILLYVGENILSILSTVTGLALLIIVVPFILFYLLKDGDQIPDLLTKGLSGKAVIETKRILSEMNHALSSYIQGQILVSIIVGIAMYVGYLIIGLDFALLLAIIAMVTNIIPYAGPFIGLAFALVVGLMDSPSMGLAVCIVVLVVQQIESNLISPQIIGNKLRIHPLTIIFLLLFSSKLLGVIGLLIAVPTYAVSKVVVVNAFTLWKIKKDGKKKLKIHPEFTKDHS